MNKLIQVDGVYRVALALQGANRKGGAPESGVRQYLLRYFKYIIVVKY